MENINNFEKRENHIKFSVIFNLDKEIKRITSTIEKLPWYQDLGYGESHYFLPEQVDEQSSSEKIKNVVSAEFFENEEKYKDLTSYIEEKWLVIADGLEKLKEISSFHLFERYVIILTRYGSGGSYDSKNGEVIANIEFLSKDKIMGTIAHEIIHIGIQHLIEKYNIKHWYKERLADLIGARYFLDLRKKQNIKEDINIVDITFDKLFPDIEAVTCQIGEK